jgi:hypothetical protein
VQNPALAYATTFAIEFLQKNFRERRGWVIANLSFDGAAIRKCDVYNASGNSVAPRMTWPSSAVLLISSSPASGIFMFL